MRRLLKNKIIAKINYPIDKFKGDPFRWMMIVYMLLMTYLGTLLIVQGILHLEFKYAVPQIATVPLNNGFIYITKNKSIVDKEGHVIVSEGLKKMGISGKTIYGHYDGLKVDTLYFICTYGEDCSNSLNYDNKEYRKALREKGLSELSFPFFEYPIGLVTKEWLKRKLTLQDAPPAPFFKDSYSDKMIKEGLESIWGLIIAVVTYTSYGIYVLITLIVLTGYAAFLIYKRLKEEIKNLGSEEALFFLSKRLSLGLLKSYVYSVSFVMTLLYFFSFN